MTYRIYGNEMSPFSVKVRSYFRYKGVPHEWVDQTPATAPEFSRFARLPLVPLVITPDDEGLQDSTPIIETIEKRVPDPHIVPDDPALAFLSAVMEDYADEWANKWMFHFRWTYDKDQRSAAARICKGAMPGLTGKDLATGEEMIRRRMTGRLIYVGSNEITRTVIETSFRRAMTMMERHLETRSFLFGERPALADFGLAGQLYELLSDPTPGAFLHANCPKLCDYIQRMEDPVPRGEFHSFEDVTKSLTPFLSEEVAHHFLPWSDANAKAIKQGQTSFSLDILGQKFVQTPQKYHAKALAELRRKYSQVKHLEYLDEVLLETGMKTWLAGE
jgi:glutathione S-transferase